MEDVDTAMEDHIYDELRYMCMERPVPARRVRDGALLEYDPLDTAKESYPLRVRYR